MNWILLAAIVLTFPSIRTQTVSVTGNNMRDGDPEIYVMNADGSNPRRLTHAPGRDAHPFFSRDGRKLVFQSLELYVMDADGKNQRRLTNTRATERAGVWAPDGKRITFSSDGDGPGHIYVINADGSKLVCLTESQTAPDSKSKSVLLVSLIGERQVAVIDPVTQQVLARMPSPQGPHEITLSPDGTLAYVADSGSGPNSPGNSIVVLDLRTLSVKTTLKTCASPHDTRVSRDGNTVWVACAPAKAIVELDATTGTIRKTWDTKLDGGWFVEITPDDRKLFVPHLEAKALTVIDRRTNVVRTLVSGTTIFAVTVSPSGNEVWVSDADANTFSIVNTAAEKVTSTVSLGTAKNGQGNFARLRFTPDGKHVVAVRGSEFIVVDVQRRSIVSRIDMPHQGKVVTVSGDSRLAFVSHPGADSVSVINLVTRSVERTFRVGKQPDGIAWVENAGAALRAFNKN